LLTIYIIALLTLQIGTLRYTSFTPKVRIYYNKLLPSSIPMTIEAKLSSINIISAACLLTSDPVIPIAIPTTLYKKILKYQGGFYDGLAVVSPTDLSRVHISSLTKPNPNPQHLRDMIHISGSQRASDETASRCNNINIFKSKLKTFLFTQAYDVT